MKSRSNVKLISEETKQKKMFMSIDGDDYCDDDDYGCDDDDDGLAYLVYTYTSG